MTPIKTQSSYIFLLSVWRCLLAAVISPTESMKTQSNLLASVRRPVATADSVNDYNQTSVIVRDVIFHLLIHSRGK